MTLTELFPHLAPDASWTIQNKAGDRMLAIYSADAAKRQAAAIGEQNVHLGGVRIMSAGKLGTYSIGLDFAGSMGTWIIHYRLVASKRDQHRRHYIEQALRLRGALCWCGLDPKMRK